MKNLRVVNTPVRKKDAMKLVTGQPVYLEDVVPKGYLVVKLRPAGAGPQDALRG